MKPSAPYEALTHSGYEVMIFPTQKETCIVSRSNAGFIHYLPDFEKSREPSACSSPLFIAIGRTPGKEKDAEPKLCVFVIVLVLT